MLGWVLGSAAVFVLMLSGGCYPTPTPIVDMTGIDQGTYSRDLAKCVDQEGQKVVVLGNGVTRCMKKKGYKILEGYDVPPHREDRF